MGKMNLAEQVRAIEKRLAKVIGVDGKITIAKASLNINPNAYVTLDLTIALHNKNGWLIFMRNSYKSVSDVLAAIEETIEKEK